MKRKKDPIADPRFVAAVALVKRTGAASCQLRFSDDEAPIVWMAVAEYPDGRWEVAAGHDPAEATYRLCDQLLDGGQCRHCGRPAGFDVVGDPLPLADHVCWYQFDRASESFQRGCVGRTS